MTADDGPFQFEEIPLEEARLMGRAPRMEPLLYDTLRMAHELGVPVMVRRVAGGVIFWRATEAEREQAQDMAQRLQNAR
jgi:hypothetical protein